MGRPRTAAADKARADDSKANKSRKGASKQSASVSASASFPPTPSTDLTTLLSSLTSLLSSPAAFLSPSPALRASLLSHLESLYAQQLSTSAASKLLPPSALLSILPSLLTTGFTVDQIFEQWHILQRPLTERVKHTVRDVLRHSALVRDEQKGAEEEAEEGDEQMVDEDDVDGEEEMDGEEDEDDVLGDEEAEMEARLDAIQHSEREEHKDEEDGEEDDTNADVEEEGEEDDEEDEEEEQQPEMKRDKLPVNNQRSKRSAAPSTATALPTSEDAFFSLDQMERFADHYEDVDNRAETNDEDQHAADSDDAEGGEWDDEVDLDADVGEVDLGGGERYDDFFDAPTEEELKGQSISDMHRQEDEEDEDGTLGGRRVEDEDELEAEGGEAGLEVDGDDDGVPAAAEGDEFGGFFARLASHRRAQDKKSSQQQPHPQAAAQPPSASDSTKPAAVLSHFAQQQQSLSSTLQQLEQQLITPKPWYHRGEVSAMERPSDSLLTTDLQIESNVKQREVMTRAINESIEEIVRRRVSEGRYDDPVKRTAVKAKPYKVKEGTEVSSEKSTLGLSQLYEEQYMEQKAREDAVVNGATATAADGTTKPHKSKQQLERDKQVSEIRTLFASLVADLSALSQYSYVPSERSEVRIVRDKDESDVLAAEEVGIDFESGVREGRSVNEVMRGKRSGEMVGEGERQQVERKRRRRQMKERGQKRKRVQAVEDSHKQLAAGVNGIGTRKVLSQDELKKALNAANVKKGTVTGGATAGGRSNGGLNKSGKFFSQLQQNVAAVEADARREGMLK